MSLRTQIIRFGLVGVLNTSITIASIVLLTWLGMHAVPANAIGFALGLANSFYLNRQFTFAGAKNSSVLPFLVSFSIAYLANLLVVLVAVQIVPSYPLVSQAAGMLTYNVLFFLLMKVWVFASVAEQR